jgi:hypothetical protein
MKTYGSKNPPPRSAAALAALLLCAAAAATTGCTLGRGGVASAQDAQGSQPKKKTTLPKPQDTSTTLRLPEAVRAEEAQGRASVAENATLGFAMDLNEKLVRGKWDVRATVTGVDERAVAFRTDKGEAGRLAYRLPQGMRLAVSPGQALFVKRETVGFESSQGFTLTVATQDGTLLSSGRLVGPGPLEVRVSPDSVIRQSPERRTQVSASKYETTYSIPVVVVTPGGPSGAAVVGKLTDATVEGKGFSILVRESVLVVPAAGMRGVFDGGGYVLEYVVAKSPVPHTEPEPKRTPLPVVPPAR